VFAEHMRGKTTDKPGASPNSPSHLSNYTTLHSYGLSLGVLLLLLAQCCRMRRREPPFIVGEEGVI
jgi:hypothetical protein